MTNSKQKGNRGERAWRDQLREAGFLKSHRGQQYSGAAGNADVVCPELPTIHFEVKYTQRLDLYGAVLQAVDDASAVNKIPVVAHRRNHSDWLVIMRADEWFNLVKDAGYAKSIFCPSCKSSEVVCNGKNYKGHQQMICKNIACKQESFNIY